MTSIIVLLSTTPCCGFHTQTINNSHNRNSWVTHKLFLHLSGQINTEQLRFLLRFCHHISVQPHGQYSTCILQPSTASSIKPLSMSICFHRAEYRSFLVVIVLLGQCILMLINTLDSLLQILNQATYSTSQWDGPTVCCCPVNERDSHSIHSLPLRLPGASDAHHVPSRCSKMLRKFIESRSCIGFSARRWVSPTSAASLHPLGSSRCQHLLCTGGEILSFYAPNQAVVLLLTYLSCDGVTWPLDGLSPAPSRLSQAFKLSMIIILSYSSSSLFIGCCFL